jgi:hypothetical protein
MKNQMPVPSESVEQICLFRWAMFEEGVHPELALLYHIPNGGKRTITTAKRLKAEGVKSGVPDIHLPVARRGYHGLYIELKRLQGNNTTETQDYWIEALNDQGYLAIVCRGWNEASEKILDYLGY